MDFALATKIVVKNDIDMNIAKEDKTRYLIEKYDLVFSFTTVCRFLAKSSFRLCIQSL